MGWCCYCCFCAVLLLTCFCLRVNLFRLVGLVELVECLDWDKAVWCGIENLPWDSLSVPIDFFDSYYLSSVKRNRFGVGESVEVESIDSWVFASRKTSYLYDAKLLYSKKLSWSYLGTSHVSAEVDVVTSYWLLFNQRLRPRSFMGLPLDVTAGDYTLRESAAVAYSTSELLSPCAPSLLFYWSYWQWLIFTSDAK